MGQAIKAAVSPYLDTAPREEQSSGVFPKPRAKPLTRRGNPNPSLNPKLEQLLVRVADAYCVAPESMRGHDRHKTTSFARGVFWLMARAANAFSYPELGRLIGDEAGAFDHTSVMSAVRRVETEIAKGTPRGLVAKGLIEGTEGT